MGQPEIKAGVASAMGPWIIRELLGPAYATDLCLSGRIMDARSAGGSVYSTAWCRVKRCWPRHCASRKELAALPRDAMRLTKTRLATLSEAGFQDSFGHWRRMLRQTLAGAEEGETYLRPVR